MAASGRDSRVRMLALLAAAVLAGQPAGAAPAPKAQRIMSTNLCTDLLLLQLAPRARIVSISFLAHDGAQSLFPGLDAGIPVNHGSSEEIVRFRPDLIVTGEYASALTREVARRLGVRIVTVKEATDFAGIRTNLGRIGRAVGEPARAAALIGAMDAELAGLAEGPPQPRRRVVAWSGGTSAPGKDSLANTIIETAGAVNVAALPGADPATFDVEQLAVARPDALLFGGAVAREPSLQREAGRHPLVRRLYGERRIAYRDAAYTCGLPQSATAAADLRRALATLPPLGSRP